MNRRQLFGRLARLAGGLGYAAWQTKGCLTPEPLHAQTPKSVVFDIPEGNDAPEVEALQAALRETKHAAYWLGRIQASEPALGELNYNGVLGARLTDYGQKLAAHEYDNRVNLADEYRRLLQAHGYRAAAALAGCLHTDGSVDGMKLSAWERDQFGPGWIQPGHPTSIRLWQGYRDAIISGDRFDDWYRDPAPGFVGGPDAQPVTTLTAALPDAQTTLIVSGGRAYEAKPGVALTVCADAPHVAVDKQLGIAIRFIRHYDIKKDQQPRKLDAYVEKALRVSF